MFVRLFLFHITLFLCLSLPAQQPRRELLYPGLSRAQPLPGTGVAWGSRMALPTAEGFTHRFIALYGPEHKAVRLGLAFPKVA